MAKSKAILPLVLTGRHQTKTYNGLTGLDRPYFKGQEQYKWKDKVRVKVGANKVGALFKQINQMNKGLTAQAVLKEASKPTSLIHDEFEWDDKKAAYSYRLDHARYLIRSLEVVAEIRPNQYEPVRAYVVPDKNATSRSVFIPISDALKNPANKRLLIQKAYWLLCSALRGFEVLDELSKVRAAVNALRPLF